MTWIAKDFRDHPGPTQARAGTAPTRPGCSKPRPEPPSVALRLSPHGTEHELPLPSLTLTHTLKSQNPGRHFWSPRRLQMQEVASNKWTQHEIFDFHFHTALEVGMFILASASSHGRTQINCQDLGDCSCGVNLLLPSQAQGQNLAKNTLGAFNRLLHTYNVCITYI